MPHKRLNSRTALQIWVRQQLLFAAAPQIFESRKRALCLACFLTSLLYGQLASAQNISYDNNGLTIELSENVQAAIDSGVSLTFEGEFAHNDSAFFFQWHDDVVQHSFVVTRHTLSNRYLVQERNKVEPRIFRSTSDAMAFISEAVLARFAKYHSQRFHSDADHQMRLRLSKTKLPGPMRLTAFITNDWNLDSGWTSWQLDQ
jgi:hypothetical protein